MTGSQAPRQRLVDAEGELYHRPAGLRYVWPVLILGILVEAADEVFGLVGPADLYDLWLHGLLIGAATVLILARAAYEPVTRLAWLAFGLAMVLWSVGSIGWSVVYGGLSTVPYPTFADVLYLMWYPFMAIGVAQLIRVRFPRFELERWMDGLAVVLLVLIIGFIFVVQPTVHHASQSTLAKVVDFSYPVLDMLLIGAIIGVYALLGWRPDRMWLVIGLGTVAITGADAAFGVEEAHGFGTDESYAFVWTIGAVLLAYAAWTRVPPSEGGDRPVTGMRAVVLPLAAQALAAGIQIYAFFEPVGESERVITLAVLVVSSIQIILTRPRPAAEPAPAEGRPSAQDA